MKIKAAIIILMILSLFTACGIKNYKQNTASQDVGDVPEATENSVDTSIRKYDKPTLTSEEYTKTTTDISAREYDKAELANELFFEYDSDTNTVILTDGINTLDFAVLKSQENFRGTNELFDKLNIGPYFIVESTFEYADPNSNEILYIPDYTVYNAVGQNIECIGFADENGIIENLSEPFIYGIPDNDGFNVYLKKYHCIEKSGKYHFVFDAEKNIFQGTFSEYDTENLKPIIDKYLLAQELVFRLTASSIETEYTNDKSNYYKDYIYNYSEITEKGYINEKDFLQTLNDIFTCETSEYIYEKLTSGEYPKIKIADDKLFLRLSEGGGAGAWDFDIYIDVISSDSDHIKADVIYLTQNDSEYLYIPEKRNERLIFSKTDEWKISDMPLLDILFE